MQKRQLLMNAITSLIQVIVVGASLFFLYRYLLKTIGVEQLGIWSIVLATSSVASVAKKGLSGSAVKYVAKYLAREDEETVSKVIQTTILTIGGISGVTLLAIYPLVRWILTIIITDDNILIAHDILPYALLSMWLMILSSVYYSGLDGYQRTDLRSWILMSGAVFLLALAHIVVPMYGLKGLAYAQVAQGLLVLLLSWATLRIKLSILPILPTKWDKALFKEMVGYGLNLQITNILQALYDPLTKAMLAKFGSLSMVGFYEMASRMVVQFRTLIIASNQVLVPTIADLHEKGSTDLQNIYKKSYELILYIAIPFFSAIVVFTPIISRLWIGHHEQTFVVFSYLLTLGWFFNTLIGPAYFSNLGTGEVKWNTIGHVVIGVLNVVLCITFGNLFGGNAVVAGWVISLSVGSLLITFVYHKRHNIPLRDLFPKQNRGLTIMVSVGIALAVGTYQFLNNKISLPAMMGTIVLIYSASIFIPLWIHPIRKKFVKWASEALNGSRVMDPGT